jgi:hypothetical protein
VRSSSRAILSTERAAILTSLNVHRYRRIREQSARRDQHR